MKPVMDPNYRTPKGLGFFLNVLSRLDEFLSRESRRDANIHRFTKNQIRRIALFLERNHLFNFDALRADGGRARRNRERAKRIRDEMARGISNSRWTDAVPQMSLRGSLEAGTGPAPMQGRPRPTYADQVREFKRILKEEKKDLPASVIDDFLV